MLSAGGGAESSSITRIKSGWRKFRELLPILTGRGRSLKAKGILYTACVRSVMMYGSETWALKEEDIRRTSSTDMQMVRWMCQVTLRKKKLSELLRDRLGITKVLDMLLQKRLRWYGHVERMDKENPVKRCRSMEVSGVRGKGRPCKIWNQLVNDDLRRLGLRSSYLAQDQKAWDRAIR